MSCLWVLVVLPVALVSCGDGGEDDDVSGLANPASVFCEEQGGTVEIVTDVAGNQLGVCHLGDGAQVEEWEYYRQSQQEAGGAGLANPASVFCEEQGGTVEIVTDGAGNQSGVCHLPDGTEVDEWEYFRAQSGSAGE
jgi:hypothetical protein